MGELSRWLNERGQSIARSPLSSEALAGLIGLVENATISSTIAKDVFGKMAASGQSASAIVDAEGLAQISDEAAILPIVRRIVEQHADAVAQVKAGKMNTFGFLVGQAMKASGGKASPKLVNALLKREIDGA